MRREDIPGVLDQFGPYQRRLFLLLSFPLIMIGCMTMNVVVTFYSPQHRCRIPEMPNDTFSVQSEDHLMMINRSVPVEAASDGVEQFSQCLLYADRNNVTHNTTGSDVTKSCEAWVYDDSEFDNTIVTQFNLVCEKKGVRANFNMLYMLGLLVGSPVSGLLCDKFGRKPVLVASYVLAIFVNVAMAFPVLPAVLLVYRFVQSMMFISFYIIVYVLSLELMGPSHRNLSGTLIVILWLNGCFVVAFISYGIRDWMYIQILSGAPFLLFLGCLWLVPESPVWLYSKGRAKEATDIVMKIVRYNNIQLPDDLDKPGSELADKKASGDGDHETEDPKLTGDLKSEDGEPAGDAEGKELSQHESPLEIFKYPKLVARTAIVWFNWAVVAMTYYGLTLNVSNLAGSVRLNFLLSITGELVGYIAACLLLDRLGRKGLHCSAMLLAGSACLATIFTIFFGGPDLQWMTTALSMVGKLGISASFSAIYLMTAELLPTVMRNLGMGCASTMARVGSALCPYIADLGLYFQGRLAQALPMVIFGSLALAAGLMALALPETLNRKLPDTLLEADSFDKPKSHPTMEIKPPTDTRRDNFQDASV